MTTLNVAVMAIGDPPTIGQNYIKIGDTSDGWWSGDQITIRPQPWTKPFVPNVPYDPPGEYVPPDLFHQRINYLDATYSSPWRVMHLEDAITLSIDMPGVRPANLDVVIEDHQVLVKAERFDTKQMIGHTYQLKDCYDIETVEATLDSGVLSMTIKKFPERMPKKVHVKFG